MPGRVSGLNLFWILIILFLDAGVVMSDSVDVFRWASKCCDFEKNNRNVWVFGSSIELELTRGGAVWIRRMHRYDVRLIDENATIEQVSELVKSFKNVLGSSGNASSRVR